MSNAKNLIGGAGEQLLEEGQLRDVAELAFRGYMNQEQQGRIREWQWEEAIGKILSLPAEHATVMAIGGNLRERERPYRVQNYNDRERFDRMLDRFEDAFFKAVYARRPEADDAAGKPATKVPAQRKTVRRKGVAASASGKQVQPGVA
jgi:hypothetical protein